MNLKTQRRLASKVFKVGKRRIVFDNSKKDKIKEAITKVDIKSLIKNKSIGLRSIFGSSKGRIRKKSMQRRKGRRTGQGSRKGRRTARLPNKKRWIIKVRAQRNFLKNLREKGLIKSNDYRKIYSKVKGGFFRSRRHIKLYLEEHTLLKNEEVQKTE